MSISARAMPTWAAAAVKQRARQAAAFTRAVDEGLKAGVDAALICGDLFDSNAQPRRSVEAAVAELRRLTDRGVHVVIIPGTHDVYDKRSIYRAFDLASMAGLPRGSDLLTVLTPEVPELLLKDLDLIVYGRVFATKRAPRSPLAGFDVRADDRAAWKVGMIHGSRQIPGRVESDEVIFSDAEVAASGLDYLALGHWHSFSSGRAGGTTWAYAWRARTGRRGPGRRRFRLPRAAGRRRRRRQQRAGGAPACGPHRLPCRVRRCRRGG